MTDTAGAEANAVQRECWNSAVAAKWVRHQAVMDGLLAEVTERLMAAAAPRPGHSVLDVGCGAGTVTLEAARRVGPEGRVLGLDLSAPLLERARERLRDEGLERVALLEADAQTAPLEPAGFDLVVSRFGVMFFADPVAAFGNLRAALRPGGRIAFAAWAELDANPWFAVPRRAAVDRLGEPAPAAPRSPGPFAFAEAPYVMEILTSAGFADVLVERERVALRHPGGAAEAAKLACDLGPTAGILRELEGTQDDAAAIAAAAAAAFAPFASGSEVAIPAVVNLAQARRG